jgi:Zn finger protein HypA/HybF involved in hydrogenase expression
MAKVICLECQNEIVLEEGRVYNVGDIIECPTCGSEMEVTAVNADGTLELQLVEAEK